MPRLLLQTAPTFDLELAVLDTLESAHYGSPVRGANSSSGVDIAEAYKLDN